MAKAAGKLNQKPPRKGKRLGIKMNQGQSVKKGNIIIRQRGSKIFPGQGTMMGRDFTVFAVAEGKINFRNKKDKKIVEII